MHLYVGEHSPLEFRLLLRDEAALGTFLRLALHLFLPAQQALGHGRLLLRLSLDAPTQALL